MPAESPEIKNILSQWQQWQVKLPCEPQVLSTLGQGLSNRSYLLKAGETFMVLRLNSNNAQLPGIDREREAIIWQAAYKAGVTPALLHADQSYLVSLFIPDETFSPGETGSTWTREDLTKDDLVEEVLRLMSECHAINIETQPIDYEKSIQAYWDIIENGDGQSADTGYNGRFYGATTALNDLLGQRQTMQDVLDSLIDQQPITALCHHDPVMANFVGSPERLYLIDWEYAAKGMAVMDYAALAVEWGFSDALICANTQIRLDSLVMAKKLYRYICQLWSVTQSQSPL